MTLQTLAAASCLSVAMATSTIAAPITLDFAFEGAKGTFYGLDDADGTGSASSYDLSFGFTRWTNVSTAEASFNSFVFFSGNLIMSEFSDFTFSDTSTVISDNGLYELNIFSFGPNGVAVLNFNLIDDISPIIVLDDISFVINPVAAVPLPAGGLFLLSAFGAVGALKRRKKRAA